MTRSLGSHSIDVHPQILLQNLAVKKNHRIERLVLR